MKRVLFVLSLCLLLSTSLWAGKFILVDKTTNKPIYSSPMAGPQVFVASNPTGMLGGDGQIKWYWVDVSSMSDADIKAVWNQTYDPAGEIDPNKPNVIDSGGSWSE